MSEGNYKTVKLGPKEVEIPEEWGIEKLEFFVDFYKGKGLSKKTLFKNSDYKCIHYGQLFTEYGEIINEVKSYTNIDKDVKSKKNDVLMPTSDVTPDGLGAASCVTKDDIILGGDILIIRPDKSNLFGPYLSYYINANKKRVSRLATGTNINHIYKSDMKMFMLHIPPLPEQEQIASILSTVDKVIQQTDEVIEKSKELKKGLMQDLLTKGIGHDKFKKVKLGPKEVEIPEEWGVEELSKVTLVKSSNVNKKSRPDEVPVQLCNYMDVYTNEYIDSDLDFMEATASQKEIEKFSLKKYDVIITKDSETADDIAKPTVIIEDLKNVICGYHLALITPKKDRIDGLFLSKLFLSKAINDQFTMLAQGLTRFGLKLSDIKSALVFVPPLPEQEQIASILSTVDEKIQKEKKYKEKLQELKKGLMQDLLTGKVRVRNLLQEV